MARRKTGTTRSRKKKSEEKKEEKLLPYDPPKRKYIECPACGAKIVWEPTKETEKRFIPCDPQLRIVVFAIPDGDIRQIPDDQMVKAIEIGTGKCVWGRRANDREQTHYKKHRTFDGLVPWCMGRVSHFETCTRLDKWLSGEAKYPTTESGDSGNIPATKDGDLETSGEDSDAEL